MIVVGGTYNEQVTVPDHQELAGSGLRAAAALGPTRAKLVTAVDVDTAALAASAAAALGVTIDTIERDQPVGFRYFSPVTPPSIDGPSATHTAPLVADDDTVLVFGTVETGPRSVRAGRLVVDPQRPRDLTGLDLVGLQADSSTIIANARETRALVGGITELGSAARQVRAASGAVAVVVKDGGRGCLVLSGDGDGVLTRVGPYPTRSVWPLGSGDVFAAAYAHAWDHGAEPVEAARIASGSAAWRCATREFPPLSRRLLNLVHWDQGGSFDGGTTQVPGGVAGAGGAPVALRAAAPADRAPGSRAGRAPGSPAQLDPPGRGQPR